MRGKGCGFWVRVMNKVSGKNFEGLVCLGGVIFTVDIIFVGSGEDEGREDQKFDSRFGV